MKISEIIRIPEIEKLFPKPANYEEIKADIASRGIQESIVVTNEGRLLCGYTRLSIAKELGIEEIPHRRVDITDTTAMMEYALLDNIRRRQLSDLQLVEYGLQLEAIYGKRQGERSDLGTSCPEVGSGRTRDIVAAKIEEKAGVGMSGRKYDRLKVIVAGAAPEVKEKLNRGEISQQTALNLCKFETAVQTKLLESDIDTQVKIFRGAFMKMAKGAIEISEILEIQQLICVAQTLLLILNKHTDPLRARNCSAEIQLVVEHALGGILNRRDLWEQMAVIPEDVFEKYFVKAGKAEEEITEEGLLEFWNKAKGGRLSAGRKRDKWESLIKTAQREYINCLEGAKEMTREEASDSN